MACCGVGLLPLSAKRVALKCAVAQSADCPGGRYRRPGREILAATLDGHTEHRQLASVWKTQTFFPLRCGRRRRPWRAVGRKQRACRLHGGAMPRLPGCWWPWEWSSTLLPVRGDVGWQLRRSGPGASTTGSTSLDRRVFLERARPVLELYNHAREWLEQGVWIVCADEKTSIQAQERQEAPDPAVPGHPVHVSHRYKRQGALRLFGAFSAVDSWVGGPCR